MTSFDATDIYFSQKAKLSKTIKDACNEYRSSPDWALNMEVVDTLNRAQHLCTFAMGEIRQLLNTQNPEIEILALTLMEVVIKNCPASHAVVAQPDFMRHLVKVALDQRDEGFWKGAAKKLSLKKETVINKEHLKAQTIDKALLLLRMLSDAYKDTNLYPIFFKTYKELVKQGIRFPEPTKDEDLKIFASSNSSGMGSVPKTGSRPTVHVDRSLPMIRPVVKVPDVSNPRLVQAQDTAAFLFDVLNTSEVGQDLYTGLIPEMVETVKGEQVKVLHLASDASLNEVDLMHSFAVNELLLQVLEDYNALASGKKRRYEEELNVTQMVEDAKKNQKQGQKADQKADEKVSEEDINKDAIPVALDPPPSEVKRNMNKKKSKSNLMEENPKVTTTATATATVKDTKSADPDDFLSFLEQTSGREVKQPQPVKSKSLDPLDFLDSTTTTTTTTSSTHKSTNNNNQFDLGIGSVNETNKNTTAPKVNPLTKSTSVVNPPNTKTKAKTEPKSMSMYEDNDLFNGFVNPLTPPLKSEPAPKNTEFNPFDTLDDPFSSMGSIKPADTSNNPFSALNNTTTDGKNGTGDDFDTGDDPFANFP